MVDNSKTGVGAGSIEWATPKGLFNKLDDRYWFTYDPFASLDNFLCTQFSTIDGTYMDGGPPWEPPQRLSDLDGLESPWENARVFVNPPYASTQQPCKPQDCTLRRCEKRGHHKYEFVPGIYEFMAKVASERNNAKLIVALIPASTDTDWWHEFVLPYADVHFLNGRVNFINPETGKPGKLSPAGTAVVVYKPDWLNGKRRNFDNG